MSRVRPLHRSPRYVTRYIRTSSCDQEKDGRVNHHQNCVLTNSIILITSHQNSMHFCYFSHETPYRHYFLLNVERARLPVWVSAFPSISDWAQWGADMGHPCRRRKGIRVSLLTSSCGSCHIPARSELRL